MKILIIGSGGREHAIAWKIAQNKDVTKIYAAAGNAFDTRIDKCENVALSTIDEMVAFATKHTIDLTIVGSEELLVAGIVDTFQQHGLTIFGPNKQAALLEGSKSYAKDFMNKYGVKTAQSEIFTDADKALTYIQTMQCPIVVKASGLAAGKGVVICQTKKEAVAAIDDIMVKKIFSDAGNTVVIEEFLDGIEISILSVTDSTTIVPFISAKDHKKIGEGETGLNTGGMGVIAPNPFYTDDVENKFVSDILEPTLVGIEAEGMDFAGVIFFGLMVTQNSVYLLEYNMRLGDPETQAVLPLLNNDLVDIINHAHNKTLSDLTLQWHDKKSCCVVMAASGYPVSYNKGDIITGINEAATDDISVFLAGVTHSDDGYCTNGGRVLNVVGIADTIEEARKKTYAAVQTIEFDGAYIRTDIGQI